MNNKQLQKKAAAARKLRKVQDKVILIAAGAGMFWMEDGYWDYQIDANIGLQRFIQGIGFGFDLPANSYALKTHNLDEYTTPKSTAKLVIRALQWAKEDEKRRAEEEVEPPLTAI